MNPIKFVLILSFLSVAVGPFETGVESGFEPARGCWR